MRRASGWSTETQKYGVLLPIYPGWKSKQEARSVPKVYPMLIDCSYTTLSQYHQMVLVVPQIPDHEILKAALFGFHEVVHPLLQPPDPNHAPRPPVSRPLMLLIGHEIRLHAL